MLITKPISAGSIVTIKLTSGEEIVSRFEGETDTHYKLSKPLVLTMGPQGIAMVPYMFTVSPDKDISLSKSTITVIIETDKPAADQYLQGTTGIALK